MRPAVLPLALGVLGVIAGRLGSSFKLWVEPPVPVVKVGGSIVLTLRSTCEDPAGRGDFRVAPERGRRRGPGVLELLNVSFADSAVESFYCCYGETPTLFTNLVVYQDPGPVTLEPVPWLRVGTAHQLVCRVENAAPVRSLRVTLLRDSEPLNVTTFESPEQQVADSLRVSCDLWVGRQDHGRNLSCQALLDLAPHGPQPRDTSRPQLLQVYEFPAAPQLEPDLHVAAGEEVTTSCSVSGAFPAPRFTVTLGGRPLPLTVSQDGLRATATLCHPEPGNLTLLCSVTVGPQERHSEATVHVHSIPSPWFNISSSSLAAGATLTGRCLLPPGHTERLQLRLLAGQRVLAGWQPPPLALSLTVGQEDDGLELSCEAGLWVGRRNLTRSRRIRLSVTGAQDLLLLALVPAAAVATLLAAGWVGYRVYYRQKKIRFYRLQEQQRRLQLAPAGPPGTSRGVAAAAPNGSA